MSEAPKHVWFRFSLRGLLVVVALVAGLFGAGRWAFMPEPFDSRLWKCANPMEQQPRTVRSDMVDDLLGRYDFRGWPRQQVIELLGKPDEVSGSGFEQWDMIYFLGLERAGPFSLDNEALGFRFNATDHVIDYGLSVN